MPFTSNKLKSLLRIENTKWDDAKDFNIIDNHKINSATYLFEKIENEKIQSQLEKLNS